MTWTRQIVSALVIAMCMAAGAAADDAADLTADAVAEVAPRKTSPRMDAVFKSLKESTQGNGVHLPWKPLAIGGIAVTAMTVAVKHWNRRRVSPKPLSNHRKLLIEGGRAARVSTRRLKRIAPLAQADGLSSPLVAILCPSSIKRLANSVKTSEEQAALKSLADTLFRAEGSRGVASGT